jgi:hypothetical protein
VIDDAVAVDGDRERELERSLTRPAEHHVEPHGVPAALAVATSSSTDVPEGRSLVASACARNAALRACARRTPMMIGAAAAITTPAMTPATTALKRLRC